MDTGDEQLTCSSATTIPDEIILESFSDPSYDWGIQNDPVMGGESYSSMEMMDADGGTAFFTGEVKDVPFLGVPGFIKTQSSGMKPYPDVSCCESLKLTVMGMEEYEGYRVSFGTKRAKSGFFASGFKGNFDAPVGEYGDVIIPFDMFSVEWDEATGDQKITCAEDPTVCPDMETLEDMQTIALWGEGVGGKLNLYVKAISAVGCASDSSSSTSFSSEIFDPNDEGDDMITFTINFGGIVNTENVTTPASTSSLSSSAAKRNSWSLVTTTTMIMTSVVVVVALTTSFL